MNKKVLVVYKSVTGFTNKYAEMIAGECGGTLMELKEATAEAMSGFDTVVFGGRVHVGTVDGLKQAKELWRQSKAPQFLVFAVGGAPKEVKDVIDEMWNNSLSAEERKEIPHFYMQGGICFEKMPLSDKLMMKMFYAILKKKKEKSVEDRGFEKAISSSNDFTSREYIEPLIAILKQE